MTISYYLVSVKKISGKVFYTVYIVYILYFYYSFRLKTAGVIINESRKKVTDLENEVRGLNVTVEKKEHAIKALKEERDDCPNGYVHLLFFTESTVSD